MAKLLDTSGLTYVDSFRPLSCPDMPITASESALQIAMNSSPGTLPHHISADGNGNITDYVDTDGDVVSHREFSSFGETAAYSGTKEFTHWWSAKPYEEDTKIIRYEKRDYIPELARFLSHDPIGEEGGVNLYGYVGNCPLCFYDLLGLNFRHEHSNQWVRRPSWDSANRTHYGGTVVASIDIKMELTKCNNHHPDENGCVGLGLNSDDMLVLSWSFVWTQVAQHELAHVNDYKTITYKKMMDYIEARETCYSTKEMAEKWKEFLESDAFRQYFLWDGIVYTHARLDSAESGYDDRHKTYEAELESARKAFDDAVKAIKGE